MSAITVLFRYTSLAGASVKRKISEFRGAPDKASCMSKRASMIILVKTVYTSTRFFRADFEVVSITLQHLKS